MHKIGARVFVATFVATLLSGGLVSLAHANDGTFPRGVATTSPVTTMDVNRVSQIASKAIQDFARDLFRGADGAARSGCVTTGGLCAVGTGFNVNATAGRCFLDYPAGATTWVSSFRVVDIPATEAATDWDANPVEAGTTVYYVKAKPGHATADGVEGADPVYLVDTDATTTGYLTLCAVSIDSTDASAAEYTITDSRTVFAGPTYNPGDYAVGDDLDVAGDANVVGTLTGGPKGGPAVWTLGVTGGDLTLGDDLVVGDDAKIGDDANIVGTLTFGPDGGPAKATIDAAAGTADFDGTCDAGDLSVDGAVIGATPAEIDAVADLSAVGILPRVCMFDVDDGPKRGAGAHTICTLPADAIVLDVFYFVDTVETTGTKTVDVGPADGADDYMNDAPVDGATGWRFPGPALDGGSAYLATNTLGTLLSTFVAGTSATEPGSFFRKWDGSSGTKAIVYTVPGGGWTEFVGTFVVRYLLPAP